MTVSTPNNLNTFACIGGVDYDFDFKITEKTDLVVTHRSTANVDTPLALTTDFTVSDGPWPTGGRVTTVSTYSTGTLIVRRKLARTQEADYIKAGPFKEETHEGALDKLTMIAQELDEAIERSIRLSDTDISGADTTLPTPLANYLLGWSSDGLSIENKAAADVATAVVSAYIATLLDDSTSSEALTTLRSPRPNHIVNSAFEVWQIGTSVTSGAAPVYGPDRWALFRTGGIAESTLDRQSSAAQNSRYAMRIRRSNGTSNLAPLRVCYVFTTDESLRFAGKNITLSFQAIAGANFSSTSQEFTASIYRGTGTDEAAASLLAGTWTGQALAGSGVFNISTSTIGKHVLDDISIPSGTTQIAIVMEYTPTGTAGIADAVNITEVKLEIGDGGTDYVQQPVLEDYLRCLRHRQVFNVNISEGLCLGQCVSATQAVGLLSFQAPMRSTPTVTIDNPTVNWTVTNSSGSAVALTNLTASAAANGIALTGTAASGLTAGHATRFSRQTNNSKITLSAEL